MQKHQIYAAARHFKQMGIPVQNWPVFFCNPISRMEQEEAIEKSKDRHRKKLLKRTKEGRKELSQEKHLEGFIRKVFARVDVKGKSE